MSVSTAEAAKLEVVFPSGQGIVRVGETRACARTCARDVPSGTAVTVRAAATDELVFAGWDDATPCVEGNGPVCTVTVPASGLRLIALFEVEPTETLVVELVGPGRIERRPGWRCSGAARCRVPVAPGTPVKIAVVPAPGRSVAYWSVWECEAPSTSCSFTADQRQTVSVYLTPVTVTLRRRGPGGVQLGPPPRTCGAVCRRDFAWGANVSVRVTSNARGFLDWGSDLCGSRTTCRFVAREPAELTARFRANDDRRGGGGGIGEDDQRRQQGPGLPAVATKNLTLTVDGPGKVYIYNQRRYCRSDEVCVLPSSPRSSIRLRAEGPFVSWRSTTCPKRKTECEFKPQYVDSVRAVFRR